MIDAFVDLLVTGVNIPRTQIFCTSLEGMGIPTGSDFVAFIKSKLDSAAFVIAIITPQYYESIFCACELGATWIMGKDFFPILVPPLDYQDLKAVLHPSQVAKIDQAQKLSELYDRLLKAGFGSANTGMWQVKRDAFLKALPKLLKQLKAPTQVPIEKHEELSNAYEAAQTVIGEKEQEIGELKQIVSELRNTKDRAEVQKVMQRHSTETERFNALVTSFTRATPSVPNCAKEAMYYLLKGEMYSPKTGWGTDNLWDEVATAKETQFLFESNDIFRLNDGHPKVKVALSALVDLREFLETVSPEFVQQFEETYQTPLGLDNRDFWHKKLGLRYS